MFSLLVFFFNNPIDFQITIYVHYIGYTTVVVGPLKAIASVLFPLNHTHLPAITIFNFVVNDTS